MVREKEQRMNHSMKIRILVLGLSVLAFLVTGQNSAWAQATASLRGTVTDPSGGIVAGAKVTLTNAATNIARESATGADGSYLFEVVQPGTYKLTVSNSGFATFTQAGIVLEVNQNGRLDVKLQIGQSTQVVEVTANVAQVDTTGAVLGKVEDSRRLQDLPILNREDGTLSLGLLQAGVFAADQDDGSGNPFSVSGQRSESMTFLVDGADNTDFLSNRIVQNPIPDAVQEFKILTNNYDAQYGRTSGGIINQVIKSGSNSFHGDVFEGFRNDVLDAKDFFLPTRAPFKRNTFGGTLGGPIKKDKVFFFGAYQGARRREGQLAPVLQVLSPAERTGNFAETCPEGFDAGGNCANAANQLINPVTGLNYPNNQVPVNPIIANYINKFLPFPNLPGNNFVSSPVGRVRDDQFVIRSDANLTSRDTLSFHFQFEDNADFFPFRLNKGASTGGNVPVGSAITDTARRQVGSLTWTHSFSPRLTNQARFAANRRATLQSNPVDKTPPSALGFKNVNPDDPNGVAPPVIFTNSFNLGPEPQGPTTLHDATFQFQDDVTLVRGKHEWKFGADVRRVRNNFVFDFFNNGSFDFTFGNFTGNELADFVGGFTDEYFQFSKAIYAIRESSYYEYAQDTWKVLPRLTLNLGLRYEYNTPQTDPHKEIMGFAPGHQSVVFPNAPPNIVYSGDPGVGGPGVVFPDRNNFAPRVGFAWDIFGNSKLVMRGGGGIFYDIEDGALNLQFGGQPPFGDAVLTFPGASNFANGDNIADPFTTFGIPNPFPFTKVGTFFVPKISFAFLTDPHFRTPYSENYNFGFQYQLTPNTVVEAVYVGSLGRKLIQTEEPNFPVASVEKQQIAQFGFDNPDCSRPLAACTLDGNLPSSTNPTTTNPNGIPTGATLLLYNLSNGLSDSHELQLTIDKRFSHGFTVRTAYTLSKTIDTLSGFRSRSGQSTNPLNYRQDRALADFDTPQRLVISGLWELPFDKPFHSPGGFVKRMTQGWEIAAVAAFQAGNPFTFFSESNSSQQNNFLDRPDINGPVTKFDPRKVQTFTSDCTGGTVTGNFLVNPTVFDCSNVPIFTFGNLGRNAIRGPGINNWDLSLIKRTSITERLKIEFRAEFFNAFNHAQFLNPSDKSSGTFGQVTLSRDPRLGQLSLRLAF
jgi:carboxypeptidase family protein/TonB-dependent receptor-like protein